MSQLVAEREANGEFADLTDFLKRLPQAVANKKQKEHLNSAGALDTQHGNRRELLENVETILGFADTVRQDAQSSQDSLFSGDDALDKAVHIQAFEDWSGMDRLREEFESLGLYLSAHPLDGYVGRLERLKVITANELAAMIESRNLKPRVNLAGSVSAKQVRISQRGNKFAFVQFTDQTGVFEVTFFSDMLAESQELLDSDMPVLVSANLRLEENGPRITAARVQALDEAIAAWNGGVGIWVQDDKPLPALKSLLEEDGPGRAEVKLRLIMDDKEVSVALPGRFRLSGEARRSMRQIRASSRYRNSRHILRPSRLFGLHFRRALVTPRAIHTCGLAPAGGSRQGLSGEGGNTFHFPHGGSTGEQELLDVSATFTMREMLEAGVHFGHSTRRWNPRMKPFIFGERNKIHILDLQQTVPMLHAALKALSDVTSRGGRVLFVGTKRAAADKIAETARNCGQYYVNHRWLGGMMTNWATVSQSIRRLRELEARMEGDEINQLTKKEVLQLTRERDKLEMTLGGIKEMGGLPDMLFVIDTNKEAIAVEEANRLNIPVSPSSIPTPSPKVSIT